MNNNIIIEYTDFIKKELLKFYKIILGRNYEKKLVEPMVERYILVRYYNETNYIKTGDLIDRISKELQGVMKTIINSENKEKIKDIYSLFGYIPYFDDCYVVENDKELLEFFFQDKNIKLEFTDTVKEEVRTFLRQFSKNKEKFHNVFRSNIFYLREKRIRPNLYRLSLGQNVRISNLYSDYAIEKAFNTGTINEDKMFIQLIMASEVILISSISLDFSRFYVIDFASTFFTKEKKIERILNIIDNNLAKKHVILNINYRDYVAYKKKIDELIKRGYSFGITIDHTFDEDFSSLIFFTFVFLTKENEKYDIIIENKEQISTSLIIL